VLSNPPYSPELEPADFLLLLKLKISMKGTRFEAVSSIQQTVTRELKAIREEAFSRSFDSLYERCKRREESGGDYIDVINTFFFYLACVDFMASIQEHFFLHSGGWNQGPLDTAAT
jgi:hypothetical protein